MLNKMLEHSNIEQIGRLIEEETILKLAEDLDFSQIYKEVFQLYDLKWDKDLDDILLTMKKLEFHFTLRSTLDNKSFKDYMTCLRDAHNQMLYLIQDPRNHFPIMEENPMHSQDVLYGVPSTFKDILAEVINEFGNPT
jgi:hypothetical protein